MQIEIEIDDYLNCKDGCILIKRDGKFVSISKAEFLKEITDHLNEHDKLNEDFELFKKYHAHFVRDAKSHFQVVFNAFKLKAITGELEIEDDSVLNLDEQVANDEISVADALEKHPFLKDRFDKLFANSEEVVEFPEL